MTDSGRPDRRVLRKDRGIDESQHYPGSPSPDVLRQMADVQNVAVPDTGYTETSGDAPGLGGPAYAHEAEPASQSAKTPRLVNDSDMYPVGSPESGKTFPMTAPQSDRASVVRDYGQPAPADPSQGPTRLHRVANVRGGAADRDKYLWSRRQRQGRS
jgi:hypothetical protein